ncbi:MAG: DUF5679 domain-containing protein [Polaribacter sp.]
METQICCLKCESKTHTNNVEQETTKINRNMLKGSCIVCGAKKNIKILKNGWIEELLKI